MFYDLKKKVKFYGQHEAHEYLKHLFLEKERTYMDFR